MHSKHHLLVSLAVGLAVAVALAESLPSLLVLSGYAAVVGVAVDLDHFLLARLNAGDWRALHACLRDPTLALFDQDRIFRESEVSALERLLSHHLLGGLAVTGLLVLSPELAVLTAIVLYAHVISDLISDVRRERVDPE